jgi:hypothetical protein
VRLDQSERRSMTHLYGPAVRCKRISSIWRLAVLHQCIRPLIGARFVLRAIMDISARAFSLADRPRMGQTGHQGSHAPGRPVLHLVSSSRRPRQENGGLCHRSLPNQCSSFVRAMRPFLRPGLHVFRGIARRDRQGWPSRLALHNVGVSRPRLDGPEHGAPLTQVGAPSRSSWHIRSYVPC